MSSKIKVDNIADQGNNNMLVKCGSTLTIGATGNTISLASGASQTGFGRTGTVDWDTTVKTTTFTAVSGDGFFCNTTSGAFTCNLPAGTAGSIVSLADYAGTFQTANLTVSPNGTQKIGGVNADVTLSTEGQSVTFIYVDDTQGWLNVQDSTSNVRGSAFISASGGTETTDGNFKMHTFTGPGTFTVSSLGASAPLNVVDYLVVAGGGGGAGDVGGAGGAGGFRLSNTTCMPAPTTSPLANPSGVTVTATAFPISVGGGGAGGTTARGNNGNDSTFSSITSTGGGRGAHRGSSKCAGTGGSGGGGAGESVTTPSTANGGAGNTPPVSPPQGNNGGAGTTSTNPRASGGGGGAGETGGSGGSSNVAGDGGDGSFVAPTMAGCHGTTGPVSSTRYFAGGGGGGTEGAPGIGGDGTLGRGGAGGGGQSPSPTSGTGPGFAGTANTGGGGSGASRQACNASGVPERLGGAGGSGIVIIRYKYQ